MRFLENALAQKIRMGKVATVAGLALTLGVTGSAAAQSTETEKLPPSHERQMDECEVTGVVVDAKTREPLPFVSVMLYKDTTKAYVVQTDFDGRYLFNVRRGKYTLVVQCVGYSEYRRDVWVRRSEEQCVMELTYNPAQYDTYNTPKVDTVGLETPITGLAEVVVVHDVKGTIIDSKNKEPQPFVPVIVLKDGKQVRSATTDLDGNFQLYLEEGEYEFLFSAVGYAQKRIPVKVPGDMPLKAIELEGTSVEMMGMVDYKVPVIDIGAPGVTSGAEIDGVQLRIQY